MPSSVPGALEELIWICKCSALQKTQAYMSWEDRNRKDCIRRPIRRKTDHEPIVIIINQLYARRDQFTHRSEGLPSCLRNFGGKPVDEFVKGFFCAHGAIVPNPSKDG